MDNSLLDRLSYVTWAFEVVLVSVFFYSMWLAIEAGAPLVFASVLMAGMIAAKTAVSIYRFKVGKEKVGALESYQRVMHLAPAGIGFVRNGRFFYVNETLARDFGYHTDELEGRKVEELVPKKVQQRHTELRRGYDREVRIMGRDIRGRTKNGRLIPVEVLLSPGATPDETVVMVLSVETQQRQRDIIQKQNETLKNLMRGMAHDLRTPLQTALMQAGLARRRARGNDRALKSIGRVEEICKSGLSLVDATMHFVKAGMKLERQPVDLDDMIGDVLVRLDLNGTAVAIADDLPVVDVDPQFSQVFQNLIGNAVKFGAENVLVASHGTHGILVQDDGPGIPVEGLEKIWLFGKQSMQSRQRVEGHGIGLPTVKMIIEAHGMGIDVASEVGEGTTFYIDLLGADMDRRLAPVAA